MKLTVLILSVIPALVASISVSPNGNSPERKMVGGMMVDVQKGFIPISTRQDEFVPKTNEINKKLKSNSTKLPINERYRRLIPYMTFYYANDMSTPTTESYVSSTKSVEIEKAEIVEAKVHEQQNSRQPKKIVYSVYRDIPRYVGNRLTQFNKASAIPVKHYNEGPSYQNIKFSPNYNPISDYIIPNYDRFVPKQTYKATSLPYTVPTRKPYLNFYDEENTANIKYYETDDQFTSKYKLVPYEQTPPVTVRTQIYNDNVQKPRKLIPVPVMIPKDQVYIGGRPATRPQYYYYDTSKIEQPLVRKPLKIVADNFYEKQQHNVELSEPTVESGFKPIPDPSLLVTGSPAYRNPEVSHHSYETRKPAVQVIETQAVSPEVHDYVSNHNQYTEPTFNTQQISISNSLTLKDLLNSLQLTKSIPKTITQENVGSSIRTLLHVLNTLKGAANIDDAPLLSSPKPFVAQKVEVETTGKPVTAQTPLPPPGYKDAAELHQEPYLAPVDQPSQHLDDIPGGTSQQFPLPVTSDEEGGTPGQPGVDYPILTTIPHTSFDCKTQRYKGFFADPETRCQVWHYCDLNGGQASFLCPNGTIFSQAGLTCDWWFNVRCASAAQLYVLNESLYKYILPHSPKFPEDYSGPLVDKYLTLKFKEMEEQFKKNKRKMSESQEDSEEESTESTNQESSTGRAPTEVIASTSEATSNDERQE